LNRRVAPGAQPIIASTFSAAMSPLDVLPFI
jgi:hypothetical protein